MDIRIKLDDKALRRALGALNPRELEKALKKSLNIAARSAKNQSVEAIGKDYNLKKKDINVVVRVKKPRQSADGSSVTIVPKPIGLEKFKPQQTPAGLTVTVSKSRGTETLGSAFLAQSRRGNKRLAFVRTRVLRAPTTRYVIYPSKKAPTRSRKHGGELPINRLYADPATEIVSPLADKISRAAAEEASVGLVVEVENILDGASTKR